MSTRKPKNRSRTHDGTEKQKYEFPCPAARPSGAAGRTQRTLPFQTLAAELGVKDERDEDAFLRRLRAMERDGQIQEPPRSYGIARKMDMVCGRVTGHPDGFGFLIPEEEGEDVFLLHAKCARRCTVTA
jgi:ribonuclease R